MTEGATRSRPIPPSACASEARNCSRNPNIHIRLRLGKLDCCGRQFQRFGRDWQVVVIGIGPVTLPSASRLISSKLISQSVVRGLVQRVASRRDTCPRGGPSDFICSDVPHDKFPPSLAGKRSSFPSRRVLSLSRRRALHALDIVSRERTGNFLPDFFFIFWKSVSNQRV
jgi:hypothetical protein